MAVNEYKIFDKTFIGIYNTVNLKYQNEKKALKYLEKGSNPMSHRTLHIARDNKKKQELNVKNQMSRKHPLFEVTLLPPQPGATMVDGFVMTLLLGECFEILHKIVAISPENAHQSLDHISQLMVSNQTADWVSN